MSDSKPNLGSDSKTPKPKDKRSKRQRYLSAAEDAMMEGKKAPTWDQWQSQNPD